MFYVAEAFLLGVGLSFSRHAGVIAAFGERFAKTGIVPVELHRYLIEGQDKRNVGDYLAPFCTSRLDGAWWRHCVPGPSPASIILALLLLLATRSFSHQPDIAPRCTTHHPNSAHKG
jgi:hypothetical protein